MIPLALALATRFAPSLVDLITGDKGGEVAEKVIEMAKVATGDTDSGSLVQSMLNSPKAQLEFSRAAMSHQEEMYKISTADTANARNREIKIGGYSVPILAGVFVVGFFGAAYLILSNKVPLTGEAGLMVGTIFGYIASNTNQIVSYYFGSSAGQDEQIGRTK